MKLLTALLFLFVSIITYAQDRPEQELVACNLDVFTQAEKSAPFPLKSVGSHHFNIWVTPQSSWLNSGNKSWTFEAHKIDAMTLSPFTRAGSDADHPDYVFKKNPQLDDLKKNFQVKGYYLQYLDLARPGMVPINYFRVILTIPSDRIEKLLLQSNVPKNQIPKLAETQFSKRPLALRAYTSNNAERNNAQPVKVKIFSLQGDDSTPLHTLVFRCEDSIRRGWGWGAIHQQL
jgi:hypothetical protein